MYAFGSCCRSKVYQQDCRCSCRYQMPNDVLLLGRKLVGILTEMNAEFGHINYVVIAPASTPTLSRDYPKKYAICCSGG